jgi:hypothetical protein
VAPERDSPATTDPESRVVKKGAGKDARLYYPESVLIENRNGVMIDLSLVGPLGGPNVTKVGLVANDARAAPDHVGGDKGC